MLKEEKGKRILYAPLCPKEGYERQSKNYLPASGGKLSLFHSVQAEADVQYLCVCAWRPVTLQLLTNVNVWISVESWGCKNRGKKKKTKGKKKRWCQNLTPSGVHLPFVERAFNTELLRGHLKKIKCHVNRWTVFQEFIPDVASRWWFSHSLIVKTEVIAVTDKTSSQHKM